MCVYLNYICLGLQTQGFAELKAVKKAAAFFSPKKDRLLLASFYVSLLLVKCKKD